VCGLLRWAGVGAGRFEAGVAEEFARLVSDLAADLVQRVGREHHDVKRVHAADRVRETVGDRAGDPAGHVAGHQFDLFAARFAELIEERLDGLGPVVRKLSPGAK
jgi:DNA recombination-dependent growth factor C